MSHAKPRRSTSTPLPSGHITFLFTDMEASSAAWERRPEAARLALHFHDETTAAVTASHNGTLVKHTGDGVESVFTTTADAVEAAVEMQRRFQQHDTGDAERIRVRIGLHCGQAEPDGDDYYGGVINRAARVADTANGDQIAVTQAVVAAVDDDTATQVEYIDCGLAQLKGCGQERIFLVAAEGLQVDDRPLRIRRALAGSDLPPERGRLIGRVEEKQRINDFLNERRLVSLIGLGGIGKTRLAVSAARDRHNSYADGVVFCQLAPIEADSTDPEASVFETLASALGARPQPGHDLLWSIVNFVEGRDILVVLDNCEHVNEAARSVVERLLSVDGPSVLVTTREPLDVPGEQRLNVEPLPVASDAVDLLIERAVERDPSFDGARHRETLQQICERLDGIPLALELAAARLRVLTPDRLLSGLSDGMDMLGSSSSADGRNPLLATIAWSVGQLDARQRSLLQSLSVFSGGFTLGAAAQVVGEVDEIELLDDLTELVELSLTRSRPGHDEIRFNMLETIRRFGLDQLDQTDSAAKLAVAHATYFADLARHCGRNLMTDAEAEIWSRIDAEGNNIRTAYETMVSVDRLHDAKDIVVSLTWFATFSMQMEIFGWATHLLETPELADSPELWAVRAIGQYLGADNAAVASAETSLRLDPTDPTGLARTTLASVALNNTFDVEQSAMVTEAMLAHPSEQFPEQRIAALGLRTFHLCLREPNPAAAKLAAQAMAEAERTGSASALTMAYWAQTLANLGIDWATAEEATQQGLAMARSLTNNHLISHLISGLVVHFASLTGSVSEAATITAAEIRATMDKHYLVGASHLLGAASVVLARAGRVTDGATLLGAMVSNGHRPRRDIRHAVEKAKSSASESDGDSDGDSDTDGGQNSDRGRGWSINKAGQQAIVWLDEVVAESTATEESQ